MKRAQAQKLVRERECKEMLAEDDLAMAIRTEEKKAEQLARSRRFEVLRRLHAIDATRVHQRAESSDRDAPRRLPSRRRWSSTRSRTRRL